MMLPQRTLLCVLVILLSCTVCGSAKASPVFDQVYVLDTAQSVSDHFSSVSGDSTTIVILHAEKQSPQQPNPEESDDTLRTSVVVPFKGFCKTLSTKLTTDSSKDIDVVVINKFNDAAFTAFRESVIPKQVGF